MWRGSLARAPAGADANPGPGSGWQVVLAGLAACALVVAVGTYSQRTTLQQQYASSLDQAMARKVMQDEWQLQFDVRRQQQMLKSESAGTQMLEKRAYPDGCVCECPATGCDEENHEGPVCHCPKEAHLGDGTSLPPPFEPWPFHQPGAARAGRPQGLPNQALYSGNMAQQMRPVAQMMQPHARPAGLARFQQKWVGSPQKFLPPDGDYPGGSTGIPLDGYLAYETGWANDGPFHGELAPMQEAGIADKARPQALRAGSLPPQMMQPHARPAGKLARFQQKWVGSPQKFLPPDGDYPGGSTGIPLDGYLAYETGWANDGPFHGELAPMQVIALPVLASCPACSKCATYARSASAEIMGRGLSQIDAVCLNKMMGLRLYDCTEAPWLLWWMQEAGIADKAQRPQSLRAMPQPKQLAAARSHRKMYKKAPARKQAKGSMLAAHKSLLGDEMFGLDFDERVPAKAVDSDLFARSRTKSATLDAFDSLIR